MIDRVDALATIVRGAADLPRAQTLVDDAVGLLGHVLRDAALLKELLAECPSADPADRRGVVVACGMLGVAPDLAVAVPNPRDVLDTRAYVLACVLANVDGAAALIRAADRRAQGAARDVTDRALQQVEDGVPITVIG